MRYPALAHRNIYLIFNGVDAFKIRKQEPPSRTARYDDTVALGVELLLGGDPLGRRQHVDVVDKVVKLIGPSASRGGKQKFDLECRYQGDDE